MIPSVSVVLLLGLAVLPVFSAPVTSRPTLASGPVYLVAQHAAEASGQLLHVARYAYVHRPSLVQLPPSSHGKRAEISEPALSYARIIARGITEGTQPRTFMQKFRNIFKKPNTATPQGAPKPVLAQATDSVPRPISPSDVPLESTTVTDYLNEWLDLPAAKSKQVVKFIKSKPAIYKNGAYFVIDPSVNPKKLGGAMTREGVDLIDTLVEGSTSKKGVESAWESFISKRVHFA